MSQSSMALNVFFVQSGRQQQTVEEALYIIGKNVLGANVTDR